MLSAVRNVKRKIQASFRTEKPVDPDIQKAIDEAIYFNQPALKITAGLGHEIVLPNASYAPWNLDTEFQSIMKVVAGKKSLCDKYRLYELWDLMTEVSKLPEGAFLEVGVWRGGSASLMATHAKKLGIKDPFFLCDTFQGVVKSGENDPYYKSGEHADTSLKEVEDLLKDVMALDNFRILHGIFPDETSHLIPAQTKFRFCHIDVDVYQSAKETLDFVWPKLVPGGMVVFDDYGFLGCDGVTTLVNEERKKVDRIFMHNLNGHAIFIKKH